MTITVEATYERGTLKLAQPLPLNEHEKVRVTVHTTTSRARQTHGLMGWTGGPELAERFALDAEHEIGPAPTSELAWSASRNSTQS